MRPRIRLFVVCTTIGAVMLLWGLPPAGADRDGRTVKVLDRCEPESFNEAVGPGTCALHRGVGPDGVRFKPGNVTFGEFVEELPDGGHKAWEFRPDDFKIDEGEFVRAENRGGEDHTFTEVDEFGPGCIQFLNDALGLTGPPVTDCDVALDEENPSYLDPGEAVEIDDLDEGVHLFYCAIHPWMQAVVEVEED